MFGKKNKVEEKIVTDICEILKDPELKQEERNALTRVQNRLKKGEYTPRVLNNFLSQVRPLALQSKLSPSVDKFYTDIINNAYKGISWAGMMFMKF